MATALALVHHANQYLITNGYDNREGIAEIVGSVNRGLGMTAVLDLHRRHRIPLNLHVSGTLLESIAWHCPSFIGELRDHLATGFIELVGSSYGQNIMRFFGADYNRKQLNEELRLYETLLGVDPRTVRVFWPPERVWETRRMAPVLRDAALLNDGYRFVILDDRTLLSPRDRSLPRHLFDSGEHWTPDVFRAHEIENGLGLVALPIATTLRRSIPPKQDEDWHAVRKELEALLVHAAGEGETGLLAIYADDMEKVIGVWGEDGPARYGEFLEWIGDSSWIQPVKLTEWASENPAGSRRKVEVGTFQELAKEFDAGEGYERWFHSEQWAPYRACFEWAERRVRECRDAGGDPALIELAEKQLLLSNWETAWHTPATGAHGDPEDNGTPSPWARALTSHSRHAAVTAEAALHAQSACAEARAEVRDVDNDGEPDLILCNASFYAQASFRWGGRIVALYSLVGSRGALAIGNPSDDWNFLEDLNRFMETPRNHPGALADVGYENDEYRAEVLEQGNRATVRLVNTEHGSAAKGLEKIISFSAAEPGLNIRYKLPRALNRISVDCALSPDYLALLRRGAAALQEISDGAARGYAANGCGILVEPDGAEWDTTDGNCAGHARVLRVTSASREWELRIRLTGAAATKKREAA